MSPRNPGELSIKSIKSSKKGIEVAFSDDSALWLSPDSYTDFHLFLGKKVGEDEYRRLKEFADSDALYKQALGWLSSKLLSKKEVYDRLAKKSDDKKAIQTAVDRLRSQGLIDDRRLVEEYLEYRAYPALYGEKRIRFELRKRGIDASMLSRLSFDYGEEMARAEEFAKLKAQKLSKYPLSQKKAKLLSALQHQGYDLSVAEAAIAGCSFPVDSEGERASLRTEFIRAKARYERKYQGYDLREKIYSCLARKGFSSEDIKSILEEEGL